jgi:hypothetical protein
MVPKRTSIFKMNSTKRMNPVKVQMRIFWKKYNKSNFKKNNKYLISCYRSMQKDKPKVKDRYVVYRV